MGGMALKKAAKKKRRYLSKHWDVSAGALFLVYVYDENAQVLQSDGPYRDLSKADIIMRERLSAGICSWIVSYNG
jgi:hypothetical protein|tara:strand:- start:59 stop:283 length:225 start_codon:yes stop_codon:yes gene_type:complete